MIAYVSLLLSLVTIWFLVWKLKKDRGKIRQETNSIISPVAAEAEKMQLAVNAMIEQVRILSLIVVETTDPDEKNALVARIQRMEAALDELKQ